MAMMSVLCDRFTEVCRLIARAVLHHLSYGQSKGIPLAEHNAAWHHKNKLTEDEMRAIDSALKGA